MTPLALTLNACLSELWTSRDGLELDQLAYAALQRLPDDDDQAEVLLALEELEAEGQAKRNGDEWRPGGEPVYQEKENQKPDIGDCK